MWRKSIESTIFQDRDIWRFWSWCLMKASWKKHNVLVGTALVPLEPGQFVFGRKAASIELGISEQKIRTIARFLLTERLIHKKSTNKFSIITIINWERYQQDDHPHQPATNQQPTSNQPAINHKQTRKEGKEGKELYNIYIGNNTCEPTSKKFVKPSVAEIDAYCIERGNGICAKTFYDFYESKGWKIGKTPMKDWRAAIRTWENKKRGDTNGRTTGSKKTFGDSSYYDKSGSGTNQNELF